MRIGIISDCHFGFSWGTEREDDSFVQASEAFERCILEKCDLIILPGDLFDRKIPSQEVWKKALPVFSIPLVAQKSKVKIVEGVDRDLSPLIFSGIPVVAIHGTHERRAKGFVNPIELLERMGYLIHLHGERVVFEKDGERVAIHGMSGVPERYAGEVIRQMDFKPVDECYNILMIHQSIEGFVYTDDGECLTVEDLPDGFDLIINGHIHWYQEGKVKNLFLPGSTLTTQMNKVEAEHPKGFIIVDSQKNEKEFFSLKSSRELFYVEEEVKTSEDIEKVREKLGEIEKKEHSKKPLLRLKLVVGKEVSPEEARKLVPSWAIVSLKIQQIGDKKAELTHRFSMKKTSALEDGLSFLEKEMERPIRDIFEMLAEGKSDDALEEIKKLVKVDDKKGLDEKLEVSSGDCSGLKKWC